MSSILNEFAQAKRIEKLSKERQLDILRDIRKAINEAIVLAKPDFDPKYDAAEMHYDLLNELCARVSDVLSHI